MNITHEDKNILIMKHHNLAAQIMGSFFVLAGIALFLFPAISRGSMPWYVPVISLVIGFILLLVPVKDTVACSRADNTVTVTSRRLIRISQRSFAMHEVREVEMRAMIAKKNVSYELSCNLKDGSRIPLNPHRGSSSTKVKGSDMSKAYMPVVEAGQKIAVFLGVPFVQHEVSPKETDML